VEGERKQVTVLFADVKGHMDLAERVDIEAWHRIMDRLFAILCEGVHRFEGRVTQFIGDGFMVAFGSARKAVACAVGIQRTLEEHNRSSTQASRSQSSL